MGSPQKETLAHSGVTTLNPLRSRRRSRPTFVFPTLAVLTAVCSAPLPTHTSRTNEWPGHPLVGLSPSLKLALRSRRLSVEYVPDDDEFLESESLEIVGEGREDASRSLKTDTIPIRILTEFSVFNIETGQLVTLRSLLAPRDSPQLSSYCVVGYVLPVAEDEVDDTILDPDLEDCLYLRLSTILFMDVFDLGEEHKFLDRYDL